MMKKRSWTRIALSLALCTTSFACTPKKMASDITSKIMLGGAPSIEQEPDVEIAASTGLTMIKMIEAMQYDNPKNRNYKLLLARSYANYAFGFFETDMLRFQDTDVERYALSKERAKRFYQTGQRLGLDLLSQENGAFEDALTKDLNTFKKSLNGFGRKDVPSLFWTAFNWGSFINLSKDSPQAIIAFPKVEAMMQRVMELDEHYFYDGPNLFFGTSYGSRPTMLGGNSEKSKEYFEKAAKDYSRKFLMALTMYAQTTAVQAQDPALFDSLLNEVLSADAAALPEQRLANEIAKRRAAWLLANKDKFFNLEEKKQ
jgi:hypothetical protein